MITSIRDTKEFRNIAKLHASLDRVYEEGKLVCYSTIDSFNYDEETVILNVHPYNDKYVLGIDQLLQSIQSAGMLKDYSIDRTTHISRNNIERLFYRTTIAEEI